MSLFIENFCDAYYTKLGPVGIPLAIAALAAIFLSVKLYMKLFLVEFRFRRFFKRVENGNTYLLLHNDANEKNPLVCIVRDIATKHRLHSDDLRAESSYLFHRYFYKTKRGFATLRLITVISPLLGLLGTVLGIIDVFEVIGHGSGAAIDNAKLAIGIGQALWTTVVGIVIAVPALAVLYYLKHKMLGCMITATEFSYRASNIAKAASGDTATSANAHA